MAAAVKNFRHHGVDASFEDIATVAGSALGPCIVISQTAMWRWLPRCGESKILDLLYHGRIEIRLGSTTGGDGPTNVYLRRGCIASEKELDAE